MKYEIQHPYLEDALERIKKLTREDFTDSRNRLRTRSLFVDSYKSTTDSGLPAYFYLRKPFSDEEYISLYEVYMHIADPSEYNFAQFVFKDVGFWKLLSEISWFKPHISEWRQHLQVKLKSEASDEMLKILHNPESKDTIKLQAAKFLVEKSWSGAGISAQDDAGKKGRSKKEEVSTEEASVLEDMERLNVIPIREGKR